MKSVLMPLINRAKAFIIRRRFLLLGVLGYAAVTAYYMGPSVTACHDTVYGFGDNTSGPIWRFGLPGGQSPLGDFENFTNYPYGENIFSPVGFSLVLQSSYIWLLAKIAGPVCGYNLVNILGFVTAALVMCGFIYWLTRHRAIAWLSGYAVAFTPYFQYKVGGHPSYGYHALIIGAIWLFFKVLKNHKKSDALLLGLVAGACFYWDPYFSLLITVALLPVAAAWIVYRLFSLRTIKERAQRLAVFMLEWRRLLLAAAIIVGLLAPLVAVRVAYSGQINNYVDNTRGSNLEDATYCSIRPLDYFLPADANWFFDGHITSLQTRIQALRHKCNPSEYTVGISYIIGLIVILGLIIFAWEKLNHRRLFSASSGQDYRLTLFALLAMVLMAAAFALPPFIGSHRMPSYYLLHFMDAWRILNRLYLVINIGVTAIFALVVFYFAQSDVVRRIRHKRFMVYAFIGILALIYVQYQSFPPLYGSRSTFSYSKDLSSIYYWLRDQKDIKFMAAYPIDKVAESEAIGHYLTEQRIHGKRLLNSTLPNSPQESLRFSIKDLTDPQTLPILRYLGVDALEIHGLTREVLAQVPGITVVKFDAFKSPVTGGDVAIAKINDGPKLSYAILLEKRFPINGTIMKSAIDLQYEAQNDSLMKAKAIQEIGRKDGETNLVPVCFEVKMAAPTDTDSLIIQSEQGPLTGTIQLGSEYTSVKFMAKEGQVFKLHNISRHNMRLNNIGCQPQ